MTTSVEAIIRQAALDGVTLIPSRDRAVKAIGNRESVDRWLPLIREHKEAIINALVATGRAMQLTPERTAFALRNHADAIRHFRRAVRETERLAALYQSKIDAHIEAARKRLPPEGFDAWLNELELEGDRHE